MQKGKREMCQQKFKDFEAIKVAENEQILVMDWKNKIDSILNVTDTVMDLCRDY